MKKQGTNFSDYFKVMAAPTYEGKPRPMTMAEAQAFHEELLTMREALRLDDYENGCVDRTTIIMSILKSRGFEFGYISMSFDEGHKWVFHNIPYAIVKIKNRLDKIAFDPAESDKPQLMRDLKQHWIEQEGALADTLYEIENYFGIRTLEKAVKRLHSWKAREPRAGLEARP